MEGFQEDADEDDAVEIGGEAIPVVLNSTPSDMFSMQQVFVTEVLSAISHRHVRYDIL